MLPITPISSRRNCKKRRATRAKSYATKVTWMRNSQGGYTVEAEYYVPHLAHATMEPPAAVAEFRHGKVTVRAPTQNPQSTQEVIAQAVGIRKDDVTCHVTLPGGLFGPQVVSDLAAEP